MHPYNVFIFLKKQVTYHTPPRFPIHVIKSIREEASLLFKKLSLRDFARFDGWYLTPTSNLASSASQTLTRSGDIIFTDINLVSILQILFFCLENITGAAMLFLEVTLGWISQLL